MWKINLFFVLYRVISANMQLHCPITTILKNGQVKFQSRGGITAVFSCDSGYTLRGSNVSHCQTDGHWSSTLPSCIPDGLNDQRCSTKLENMSIKEGQLINISCPFNNNVDNSFWTGNGKLIQPTTYKDNTISVGNSGLYTCLGYSSREVNILRAVNVSILTHPEKCELTFTNKTSYIQAVFGSEILLSCETKPNQTMISWYKNGKLILDERFNPIFKISKMQSIHEGTYSCLAFHLNNLKCSIQKNITVKMQEIPHEDIKYECGQPVINSVRRWKRVIDGNRAAVLSAPWMGMLSKDREPPFCGCSLISDKWLISAAHCFRIKNNNDFVSQEEIEKHIIVKFGKYLRRQTEKGELIRRMQSLIIHPNFMLSSKDEKVINEHDIALGKLNESITFQENVLPICLPPPGFTAAIPTGTLGVVTGWGRVTVRGSVTALTLQEAFLPLVNNTLCQKTSSYAITDNVICAGYAESFRPDTCTGDSGGPFIFQKFNAWFLVGVVSWGEGCSTPKKFGVYTKVENYVPWIQFTTTGKLTQANKES